MLNYKLFFILQIIVLFFIFFYFFYFDQIIPNFFSIQLCQNLKFELIIIILIQMQSIVLKNFKSYQHQALQNLNSRINIVIGSNGQGKSNFFKAISFLFTDRFTINRAQFNATLYRGEKGQNPELFVEAHFSQKQEGDKNGYKISKTWSNYTNEDMKINDKSKNREQYQNFIDSFGLSYTNPYNIVQQGKISQITQMNQNQLYLLLQQTAGIKRFLKKHEEAQNNLVKVDAGLVEVQDCLKFLRQKMSQAQGKKNQYQFYSVQEKVRKLKKKRQLTNYLDSIEKTIQHMKKRHLEVLKQVQQIKTKEANLVQLIQQKQISLNVLIQKAMFYEKEHSQQIKEGQILSRSELKKSLTNKKKELKDLQKKISNEQNGLKKTQDKLFILEKQLNNYRQKYQMIKLDFQAHGDSKDTKKMKDAYQQKILTQKQAISNFQDELKKIQKLHSDFKVVNCKKQQSEFIRLQQESQQFSEQMKKVRVSLIQMGRNKMNIECQLHTLNGKKKNLEEIIKKILPMLDFRLLGWLQQNKVKGVHGYLIQHLKIDTNVSFAYQIAGLSKLCTLLVQDDQAVAQVVQINRKIKGKNVNILPLSYVKGQMTEKRVYPKNENVFSLLNQEWICCNSQKVPQEVKSGIQKIINNTFAKYTLVEDYSTALKVSKQYHLNCITADRQIVYADAYMCKVGREQTYEKGKIQLFQSFQNLTKQILSNKNSLNLLQKKEVQLQNQEIQLINKKEKLQLTINQLEKTVEQAKKIEFLIQKLEDKKISLNQSILRSSQTVKQYQKTVDNIKNNIKSKFRQEDFKNAQAQYFTKKSELENIFTESYKKQKTISIFMKDLQILNKEISNLQKLDPQQSQLLSKSLILKQIQIDRKNLQRQINSQNEQFNTMIQSKTVLKQKQLSFLASITAQQQNHKDILNKIENLRDINEQQQNQIQELSHSLSMKLSVDSINAKKRQFYTARDKVFFTKITDYVEKVNFYSESTRLLQEQKKNLLKYIQKTQIQAKQYMKSFISNFQKHFIRYFLKIVPNGKAEIRTKIHSQKIKGITKNGYSLEIQVRFNEQQGIRKWSQFSGGQKTVLALCIIFAIQKCQPTPFCVLDQVDSALDQFYAEKIIQIIVQESEFTQYFITSFKKSMMDFPESITNYYLVKNSNRISTISQVQKSQIQSFIDQITQ